MRKTQKRVPVVLDVKEVLTLIDRLTGTHQTAAKLQYGSGLRLNELVSLRIQDADPKRSTVTVRGGKGDRDRVTHLSQFLLHLGGSSYDFPGWLVLPLERFGHGSIVVFDEIEDLRV